MNAQRTPTPGEIIRAHMKERGIGRSQLATMLDVSTYKIHHMVYGDSPITAKDALGLERALGERAEYWLTMQMTHQLKLARQEAKA